MKCDDAARAIAVALLVAGCDARLPEAAPEAHLAAASPPAERSAADPTPEPERWVGVVTAGDTADIAPAAEGVLEDVPVHIGERVRAGAIVAVLDQRDARDRLRAAKAELRSERARLRRIEAELERARRELDDLRRLAEDGLATEHDRSDAELDVERSLAERDGTRAEIDKRRVQIEELERRVVDSRLRAPFDGVVAERHHDAGEIVGPGVPVLRISRDEEVWVEFAVPPSSAGTLRVSESIRADVGGVRLDGTLQRISPEIDPAAAMVFVAARLNTGSPILVQLGQAAVVTRETPP